VLALALAVDPPFDCLSDVAGVVAGALVGLLVSRYYSQRASEELEHQAANLKKLNGLTIRILDEAKLLPGNVEPTKDEAGNYTGGLTYRGTATAQGRASVQASARVIRGPDSGIPETGAGEEHQQRE